MVNWDRTSRPSPREDAGLGVIVRPIEMMTSAQWKIEAVARFREFGPDDYERWDSPYLCWFDLRFAFEKAYKPPMDEDLIRRVYEFASWCCDRSREETAENDLLTCVSVCFYEHIPECEPALQDMPRWFTLEEVYDMKKLFEYSVGEDGFKKIVAVFSGHGS